MAGEVFSDLICERSDSGVFDCHLVEWLETMHDPEGFAILLDYAEPSGSVG